MDTLTKSCSPTIVITANGEVQTHEEAIVYVKELDIFLTMKVLENTPAVLSLGKLCDENGYSYEWINGQKPHLIKDGIRIICNTENFVPIVVPGLSSSSSGSSSTSRTPMKQESHFSSSSSTSPSSPTVGDLSVREREDVTDSDISPVPVSNSVDDRSGRPDETQASKTQKPNKKETTLERGDPLYSEIPEWLQECRENLVDDEIPLQGDSHASSSLEASLEPISKRREDLGKHSVYTRAEDVFAESYFVQKFLVIWLQQITKSWMKSVNHETITGMQSWCRTQRPNGSRHIRAKQKLHKKPREACKSSWSPIGILKSLHWQFHGIRQSLWRSLLESLHVYTT